MAGRFSATQDFRPDTYDIIFYVPQPEKSAKFHPEMAKAGVDMANDLIRSRHGTSPENPQYPSKIGV